MPAMMIRDLPDSPPSAMLCASKWELIPIQLLQLARMLLTLLQRKEIIKMHEIGMFFSKIPRTGILKMCSNHSG